MPTLPFIPSTLGSLAPPDSGDDLQLPTSTQVQPPAPPQPPDPLAAIDAIIGVDRRTLTPVAPAPRAPRPVAPTPKAVSAPKQVLRDPWAEVDAVLAQPAAAPSRTGDASSLDVNLPVDQPQPPARQAAVAPLPPGTDHDGIPTLIPSLSHDGTATHVPGFDDIIGPAATLGRFGYQPRIANPTPTPAAAPQQKYWERIDPRTGRTIRVPIDANALALGATAVGAATGAVGTAFATASGALAAVPAAIGETLFDQSLPGHAGELHETPGQTTPGVAGEVLSRLLPPKLVELGQRLYAHAQMVASGQGGAVESFNEGNPPDSFSAPTSDEDAIHRAELGQPQVRPRLRAEMVTLETGRRGLNMVAKMATDPTVVALGGVEGPVGEVLAAAFGVDGVATAVKTAADPKATAEDVAEAILGAAVQTVPLAARHVIPAMREAIKTRVEADSTQTDAALATLGVSAADARDPEALRSAYLDRAKATHPDVNADPAAADQFRAARDAYTWLADHPPANAPRSLLADWKAKLFNGMRDWLTPDVPTASGAPAGPGENVTMSGRTLPGDVGEPVAREGVTPPEPPAPEFQPTGEAVAPPAVIPPELGPDAVAGPPVVARPPESPRTAEEEALYEASKAERARAAEKFKQTSVAAQDNAQMAAARETHPVLQQIDQVLAETAPAKAPTQIAEMSSAEARDAAQAGTHYFDSLYRSGEPRTKHPFFARSLMDHDMLGNGAEMTAHHGVQFTNPLVTKSRAEASVALLGKNVYDGLTGKAMKILAADDQVGEAAEKAGYDAIVTPSEVQVINKDRLPPAERAGFNETDNVYTDEAGHPLYEGIGRDRAIARAHGVTATKPAAEMSDEEMAAAIAEDLTAQGHTVGAKARSPVVAPKLALRIGNTVRPVSSLEEAGQIVDHVRDTVSEQGPGAGGSGEFHGAMVVDTNTGKPVARISYNGRIWDPNDEKRELVERADGRGFGKQKPIDIAAQHPVLKKIDDVLGSAPSEYEQPRFDTGQPVGRQSTGDAGAVGTGDRGARAQRSVPVEGHQGRARAPQADDVSRVAAHSWPETLADARAHGYRGSDDALLDLYQQKIQPVRELIAVRDEVAREHGSARLLDDIRDLGGLRPFDRNHVSGAPTTKLRGEFQSLGANFKQRGAFGKRSIFRNDGLGVDDLLDQLHQQGRYPEITDEHDLMRVLDRISRGIETSIERPSDDEIVKALHHAGGIHFGEPWWESDHDTLAHNPDEEGDATFDVHPDTGELQARLPGAESARKVGHADTTFKAPQQASGTDFALTHEGPEPKDESPDLFAQPEGDAHAVQEQGTGAGRVRGDAGVRDAEQGEAVGRGNAEPEGAAGTRREAEAPSREEPRQVPAPEKGQVGGATVTRNTARSSVEVKFAKKPTEDVRTALKRAGFRWSKTNGLWYKKAGPHAIDAVEQRAREITGTAVAATPIDGFINTEPRAEEPKAEQPKAEQETTEQKRKRIREERKQLFDDLRKRLAHKLQMNFDPGDILAVVKILRNYAEDGINEFRGAAQKFQDDWGEQARKLDVLLEAAWKRLQGETRSVADTFAVHVTPADVPEALRATQDRAIAALEKDPQAFKRRYLKDFGRVISGDNAAELFEDYAKSHESRTKLGLAVRRPAIALRNSLLLDLLAQPVEDDKAPVVLLTAGGNGSGKSTGVSDERDADIIVDSTLSNYDESKANVLRAVAAGRDVRIRYVWRDPIEALTGGVLPRAKHEGQGRTVSLDDMVRTHIGSRETVLKLAQDFADDRRVTFTIRESADSRLVGRDLPWLKAQAYDHPDALRQRLQEALDAAHAAGRVSDIVYEATAGHAPATRDNRPADGRGVREERGEEQGGPAGQGEVDGGPTATPRRPGTPVEAPLGGAPADDVGGTRGERNAGRPAARDRSADAGSGSDAAPAGSAARPSTRDDAGDRIPAGGRQRSRAVGLDYRVADDDPLGDLPESKKLTDNIAALKLLKQLADESRKATADEQATLVRYVGWGGLAHAFRSGMKGYEELRVLIKDGTITREQYEAMRASTPNAHYTSRAVIGAMYDAVARLGLTKGRVLEPSTGAGHFFGLMPEALADATTWAGVELDPTTAAIAQHLYQSANIQPVGFEKARLPGDFFDLAIGNPPFGNYAIHDPKFAGERKFLTKAIHNYFFAKTLDLIRPGGLVAFVTSHYTMDAKDSGIRDYLDKKAELLGAIRLPNTAFKRNAGTEVTTDILFLRKRDAERAGAPSAWVRTAETPVGEGEATINQYFLDHPEMVLGTHALTGSMYGSDEYTVEPSGDLAQQLAEAVAHLPAGAIQQAAPKSTEPTVADLMPAPGHVKPFAFTTQDDGSLWVRDGDTLVSQEGLPATTKARIRGMMGLRDVLRDTMRAMLSPESSEADVARAQKALNKAYDKFVDAHGYLFERGNLQAFADDPDKPLLLSLEDWDPEREIATKGPIFTKRVLSPRTPVTHADSPQAALLVSLNERGRVDWDRMSALTGQSAEALQEALRGLVYETPSGAWQPADEYLSGNVRAKLSEAKAAASIDTKFNQNVEALEAVQPEDLGPKDIDARLGSPWIPTSDIEDFILHVTGGRASVRYVPPIATWTISNGDSSTKFSVAAQETYGTRFKPAVELIELALNLKQPTVYDRHADGTSTVNQKETLAAREKQQDVKDLFKKWVWANTGHPTEKDLARGTRLARYYNDHLNTLRERVFDGSHLDLAGLDPSFVPRPHQKNGIWRQIVGGNTLLAWVVGAGKTFAVAGGAMEMRRLGLAKKPLITVPNHLVEQWGAEFLRAYPTANVLLATKRDFEKDRRKRLMARIATGDWDAVIVGHSSFGRVPVSDALFTSFMQEQIDTLERYIEEESAASGKKAKTVKELEKAKKRLQAKMEARRKREGQDDTVTFEDLGVDALFVDEAHMFKNLWFPTKMSRVAGLPNSESDRAFDMYLKTRHIQKITNGRGIVFATGTPISNTMAEMFTMQRYLAQPQLEADGLGHFDAWAQQFGEVVSAMELAPEGKGYRIRNRFARFTNFAELAKQFRSFADVQTAEMLNLPVPKLKGGKPTLVRVPASDALKAYVETLVKRAGLLRSQKIDPRIDNMLKITGDGRKAALDLRLVGLPQPPGGKLDIAAETIARIYKEWHKHKGTQLVFSDLGTPKPEKRAAAGDTPADGFGEDSGTFNVYAALREKLVAMGIPKKEIAFIHEANTDARKLALFNDVRSGKVRVLVGSTEKMGAGTNVQDRLVAKHDLDAPWRPSDVEQRDGRIIRQGNKLAATVKDFEAEIHRYLAEGSFDAYMWQILESKAKFINQAMSGDINGRSVDDVDVVMISSAAEAKAIASGNPMVFEKVKTDAEVTKLLSLKSSWEDSRWRIRNDVAMLPRRIEAQHRELADIQSIREAADIPEEFRVTVGKKTFTGQKEGGERFISAVRKTFMDTDREGTTVIGSYAGLDLAVKTVNGPTPARATEIDTLIGKGDTLFPFTRITKDTDPTGLMTRVRNYVADGLSKMEKDAQASVNYYEKKLVDAKAKANEEWDKAAQLEAALKEQERLNKALDLDARSQAEQVGAADVDAPDAEITERPGGQSGSGDAMAASPSSGLFAAQPPAGPPRPPRGGGGAPSSTRVPGAPLPEAAGLTQERKLHLGGLGTAIRALFNPEGLGREAKGAAGTIRHESALSFRELTIAREQLKDFGRHVDTLSREDAVTYWDAAEHGRPTGDPEIDAGNALLRQTTDKFTRELVALDRLKAESVRQDYVGRFWSMAPESVTDFLKRATGRRPLEGPKSFLKKRSWEHFVDGIRAIQDAQARITAGTPRDGDERLAKIRPATYNWVDSQLAKIAEMQRVIAAERMLRQEETAGRAGKILDAMGKKPPKDENGEDWVRLGPDGDPAFTIYGPRSITIKEAYDANLMAKLHNFARSLGVLHVRKIAVGGNRWGYAVGQSAITTKVGGPEGVLMHEIGHILDHKYGLRDQWVNNPEMRKELRNLADLREEGQPVSPARQRYLRKGSEKIANLVHAFIYAPERTKKVAPHAYWALHNLAKDTPELKPLLDIQKHGRSLRLEENTVEQEIPGFPVVGHWYAPKAAAAVWKNHLSKGLRGNPLYDAYMAPAQASTQLLLGLSGFHFTTIAREALNSRLAQSIDALANRGQHVALGEAARNVVTAPAAAALDAAFGRKIMQEYRAPGTHPELARVLDAMLAGGYRGTAESEFWTGERVKKLKDAFAEAVHAESKGRQLWGASKVPIDALWAGIEMTMKPLMGLYVPWLKTAATYRAVAQALAKLPPDTSTDRMHEVMSDIVKEMDYRYGQVVYDNHFAHRMVKDLAQAVFLAPGWTFGTLALATRGVKQIGKIPVNIFKKAIGKETGPVPDELVGSSAAYWIGGVLALMFINGLATYLYTGEFPQGKDYFGYRDGTFDDDGNPNRHILPGYEMRDIYGWTHHTVSTFLNKLKPTIAFMARIAQNRTYFGDMIYNPDDDVITKGEQVAKAAGKDLGLPLSIQNYQEARQRDEAGLAEAARNFFGITPAKREFVRSDAENKMAEYLSRQGHLARTPEEVEAGDERRATRDAARRGDTSAITAAQRAGSLTRRQASLARRTASETFLQRGFAHLTIDQALTVYEMATPEERAQVRTALIKKSIAQVPANARPALLARRRDAISLPVGSAAGVR